MSFMNKKLIAKKAAVLLISAFLLCILTGCGAAKLPEVVEQDTLKIGKNGAVTAYLTGDFDKTYYNVHELRDMAAREAVDYNKNHPVAGGGEAVVLKAAELFANGKKVKITTQYADTAVYADYNGAVLFYGTVAEAVKAGFDFNTKAADTEGNILTGADIRKDGDRKLIITDVRAMIYCPGKVTHVTEGMKRNADGSVDTTQSEALVYILMK